MNRRIFIFVNGIRTKPGDEGNWNIRALDWLNCEAGRRGLPWWATNVEYFTYAITRGLPWRQRGRALTLAHKINAYRNVTSGDSKMQCSGEKWDIVLIAHSNGADVVIDALQLLGFRRRIEEIHFVCPACEADFQKNGINDAMKEGKIGKVRVYCAEKDLPLRIANTWFARKILGFGTLGLNGPVNDDKSLDIKTTVWPRWGHSDALSNENLNTTLEKIVFEN